MSPRAAVMGNYARQHILTARSIRFFFDCFLHAVVSFATEYSCSRNVEEAREKNCAPFSGGFRSAAAAGQEREFIIVHPPTAGFIP